MRHAVAKYACRACATSMASVCLSVALVDFDHVEQKVKIGMWQDRSVSWLYLHAERTRIVISCDREFHGERRAG